VTTERAAACIHCGLTEFVIEGDGPPVCRPCLDRFVAIANRPEDFTDSELHTIEAQHRDRVRLIHLASGVRERTGQSRVYWQWIADWPRT
jgi:hypothetical protein